MIYDKTKNDRNDFSFYLSHFGQLWPFDL